MQLFSSDPTSQARPNRAWWLDVLVVLGVLGFGYFAVMLETAPRQPTEAQELVR
jgi:hypothetical protein